MSSVLTHGRMSVRRMENERRVSEDMVVREGRREEGREWRRKERRKERERENDEKSQSIMMKLN